MQHRGYTQKPPVSAMDCLRQLQSRLCGSVYGRSSPDSKDRSGVQHPKYGVSASVCLPTGNKHNLSNFVAWQVQRPDKKRPNLGLASPARSNPSIRNGLVGIAGENSRKSAVHRNSCPAIVNFAIDHEFQSEELVRSVVPGTPRTFHSSMARRLCPSRRRGSKRASETNSFTRPAGSGSCSRTAASSPGESSFVTNSEPIPEKD